jgi:ABC-type transport system involved in multi-copper enzyme maturation permease subunit
MQAFFAIVHDTWRQSKQQWVFIILLVMLASVTGLFCLGTKLYEHNDGSEAKYSQTLIWRWQEKPDDKFPREDGWEGVYANHISKQQGRDEKLLEAEKRIQEAEEATLEVRDQYIAKRKEVGIEPVEAKFNGLQKERAKAQAEFDEAKKNNATEAQLKELQGRLDAVVERIKPVEATLQGMNNELREIDNRYKPLEKNLTDAQEAKAKLSVDLWKEAREEVKRRSADISDLQKALESTMMDLTRFLTWLSILGFIAAASGYFPGLIAQGSIDSVLSRPVSRFQVFFGKYIGGLGLISVALFVCWLVTFISFGVISGLWHWRFFSALPMTLLSVALLYAIVAWVGLMTRSSTLALVTGYFFYLVVDTAVTVMITVAPITPLFANMKWIVKTAEFIKMTFPNFSLMRNSAEASVCNVPIVEWQPTIVAFAWLGLLLFTSYSRFRRTDF